MFGNLIQRVLSFFTIVLISRYLGPSGYGQYAFVIALVSVFAIFWNFGLNTVLVRGVSEDKSRAAEYMGDAIIIKILLYILAVFLIYVYLVLLKYDDSVILAVALFSFGTFISGITKVHEAIFAAYRRMEFSSYLNVLRSLAVLICIFLIQSNLEEKLLRVFISYLVGFVIIIIISSFIIKFKFVIPSLKLRFDKIKLLLSQSKYFFFIEASEIILFRIDHLMLSGISGDVELGYYGASYTIFEIVLSLFPTMIMASAFPVLVAKYYKDIDSFKDINSFILKLFLYIGIPMSCGLFILGNDICLLIFGSTYLPSGLLLSILGASAWLFFLVIFLGWSLTSMHLQKHVLKVSILTMVVNVIANSLLIPYYGSVGAAATTVFCVIFQFIYLFILFKKAIDIKFKLETKKILLGSLVMVIVLYTIIFLSDFNNLYLKLFILVSIGIITYFSITIPLKTITKKEIQSLRNS